MLRLALRIVLALCLLAPGGPAFAAESGRIALLIGNQAYSRAAGRLAYPQADIETVGATLEGLGFAVTKLADAGKAEMDTAIKRHARRVREAGQNAISFFYYSGHGVVNPDTNINYLIPVDVTDPNGEDVWDRSIEQRLVIDLLSERAKNATHFVVFDACRSELSIAGEAGKALGADKGFVPVADVRGMLIAYSTGAKKTAADTGRFAQILAESLQRKIPATHAFLEMQSRVVKVMRQEPWLSLGYVPPLYLAGEEAAPEAGRAGAEAEGAAVREWAAVDINSAAMLKTFIARHGGSSYAAYARARLEELSRIAAAGGSGTGGRPFGAGSKPGQAKPPEQQAAIAAPKTPPAPPKPAEDACEDGLLVSVAAGPNPCIKPGSGKSFHDCPDCPEMVVVPAGSFSMGSPSDEKERSDDESPQHKVTISNPFAVGKYVVTFDEWDTCVSDGGCKGNPSPGDQGWGRGRRPVINVKWDDAREYVKWLSRKTDKKYRLLSEAEWEYAARADTRTRYFWGDSVGRNNANCNGCGSEWDGRKTAEVGQFRPNAFGLYDMAGNVRQQTDDCWNGNYNGAPEDGSAIATGECRWRVFRGGSWADSPWDLRAAARGGGYWLNNGGWNFGFRVARTF